MLDFIHWNVNPDAITILSFPIRWYGVLFAMGFMACYYAFTEVMKHDKFSTEDTDLILVYMIVGTVIGARLGDCFFYNGSYYLQHPIEILYIRRGGLASHGAALGMLVSLFLYSRKTKRPYIWLLDRVAIIIGLGGAFIRIGNLMNSEIYGHDTTLPWGFIFELRGEVTPKHPTQIYEALFYVLLYVFLRWLYRKHSNRPNPLYMFGWFLTLLFGFRFLIEFLKNVQEPFELGLPLDMGQILSIPFVLAGIYLIYLSRKTKPEPLPVKNLKK